MDSRTLTLIPARGGSKGVPRKNVRLVGGKPLIAWSIEAAKGSKAVGDFYVSTDDEEIARVSREHGAEVLPRPPEFAQDKSPMIGVIQHALATCREKHGVEYEYFLLLQPTAPMRNSGDIDEAMRVLRDTGADSVISVYQVEDAHPSRMYLIEDGRLRPYSEEPPGSLRQDLPKVFHRNGAIYACRTSLIREQGRLWGGKLVPYIMPKKRSVNIDDPDDLAIADFLMGGTGRV